MTWKTELDELNKRRADALKMGGAASVAKQHARGRLTARERIDRLVDKGSWREIGILAGKGHYDEQGNLIEVTPSNTIIGTGRIDGRKVMISADDFTVRAGSSEATISEKWIYAENYALEQRLPLIRLVESAGGSVRLVEQSGHTKAPGYSDWPMTRLLGVVPVVGVAMGPCAGLGALKVACAHFSTMVEGNSQVFSGGPPVVARGMTQQVDKDELGGSKLHTRESGVIDNEAASEADALAMVRQFLSYLPSSVHELPPVAEASDPPERREEALLSIIPRSRRQVFKIRKLLEMVLDKGSIFEIAPYYGGSVVACLARLNGRPVGVIANDCFKFGGGLNRPAAEKFETFVDLCDTFHIPVVNFVDQPGTVVGIEGERAGNVRGSVRVVSAIEQTQTPWCAMMIRRVFGLAGSSYGRLQGVNTHYAWPSARWGSIPVEGGVEAAYRAELDQIEDDEARAERLRQIEDKYEKLASPFRTAERFRAHDIIDPRDTRPILCEWIEDAYRLLPEHLGPVARTMRR